MPLEHLELLAVVKTDDVIRPDGLLDRHGRLSLRYRDQYAHAREMQADALFDEALEIADDAAGDWTVDKDGKKTLDHEHVQRSRLRVDTRKWAAGKLAPKRYGDKLQHTGEGGGPIRTEVDLTGIPTDVLRELRKLAARI